MLSSRSNIGIIAFNDLNVSQYVYKYTKCLDKHGIPYTVIYWCRSGNVVKETYFRGEAIAYVKQLDTFQSRFTKIAAVRGYGRFLKEKITERNFDKLIVLTTQSAISIDDLLRRRYRNKYLFDYRDITYEYEVPLFRFKVKRIIQNSFCTMFSSPGFCRELGLSLDDSKIQIAHNSQDLWKDSRGIRRIHPPIRLNYWGIVRQESLIKRLCDLFGCDCRFELRFHGEGRIEWLKKYCFTKGYSNISFTGKYNYISDIDDIACKTDIVNCVYENDRNTQPTLAVKLYDALSYEIPILISKGSFLSDYLDGYSFAYSLDLDDCGRVSDQLFEWYQSLDEEKLHKDFAELRERITFDDARFEELLVAFLQE